MEIALIVITVLILSGIYITDKRKLSVPFNSAFAVFRFEEELAEISKQWKAAQSPNIVRTFKIMRSRFLSTSIILVMEETSADGKLYGMQYSRGFIKIAIQKNGKFAVSGMKDRKTDLYATQVNSAIWELWRYGKTNELYLHMSDSK